MRRVSYATGFGVTQEAGTLARVLRFRLGRNLNHWTQRELAIKQMAKYVKLIGLQFASAKCRIRPRRLEGAKIFEADFPELRKTGQCAVSTYQGI